MITLEKPVVKHLPAELDGVDLHLSTCKYIQIGGTCASVVLLFHICSNNYIETDVFSNSHCLS